jgi:hypothetical protein
MAATIKGLDRLARKMRSIPEAVKAAVRSDLERSAEEVVSMMKSLVTSDRVRATIGWTWGQVPDGAMTLGRVKASSGRMTITIYAGDNSTFVGSREQFQLAALLEFGTKPHKNEGMFAGSQHPGTAPAPFFYISYRANRKRAASSAKRAMKKALKSVAQG